MTSATALGARPSVRLPQMPPETLDLIVNSLVVGAVGALLWARLNRLEAAVDSMRGELASVRGELAKTREEMATKADVGRIERGLARTREEMATKADLERLGAQMDAMRDEMAIMRSDLTHIALAVGASRPKPAQG